MLSGTGDYAGKDQQKNGSQKNANGYPVKIGGGHNDPSLLSTAVVGKVPRGHPETQKFANLEALALTLSRLQKS